MKDRLYNIRAGRRRVQKRRRAAQQGVATGVCNVMQSRLKRITIVVMTLEVLPPPPLS